MAKTKDLQIKIGHIYLNRSGHPYVVHPNDGSKYESKTRYPFVATAISEDCSLPEYTVAVDGTYFDQPGDSETGYDLVELVGSIARLQGVYPRDWLLNAAMRGIRLFLGYLEQFNELKDIVPTKEVLKLLHSYLDVAFPVAGIYKASKKKVAKRVSKPKSRAVKKKGTSAKKGDRSNEKILRPGKKAR